MAELTWMGGKCRQRYPLPYNKIALYIVYDKAI